MIPQSEMTELTKRIVSLSKLFDEYMSTVLATLKKMIEKVERIEAMLKSRGD